MIYPAFYTGCMCHSDVKEKVLDEGLSKANWDNILEYLSVRKDNSFSRMDANSNTRIPASANRIPAKTI